MREDAVTVRELAAIIEAASIWHSEYTDPDGSGATLLDLKRILASVDTDAVLRDDKVTDYPAPEQRVRAFLDGTPDQYVHDFDAEHELDLNDVRDVLNKLDSYRTDSEQFVERMETMRGHLQRANDEADSYRTQMERARELAAIIEKAREHLGGSFIAADGYRSVAVANGAAIRALFDSADTDAVLRERDAEKFDEGQRSVTIGLYPNGPSREFGPNPYREGS
jgi:hypothetical protein